MVGHVSGDAMATGRLEIYSFCLLLFGMGVLLGLDPIVSQAAARADEPAARLATAARTSARRDVDDSARGPALARASVLLALGQPEAIVATAAGFVRASILGIAPFLFVTVMRQSLQARHRVRPILIAIVGRQLVTWDSMGADLRTPRRARDWARSLGMGDRDERWFLNVRDRGARLAGLASDTCSRGGATCSTRGDAAASSRSACRLEDRSFSKRGAFNRRGAADAGGARRSSPAPVG